MRQPDPDKTSLLSGRIYIVRHGKTDLNRAFLLQGRSDQPLNEEGVLQAKEAAEKLKDISFSHVFSSPLIRALETAKIIVPDAQIRIDERLIEMDYGPYEGIDLKDPPKEVLAFFRDFVHVKAPAGMEQLSDVVSRMASFLEEIRMLKGNILISTHAIAMKGALEYLTPASKGSYWSKYIGNCAVYVSENEDGKIGIPVQI